MNSMTMLLLLALAAAAVGDERGVRVDIRARYGQHGIVRENREYLTGDSIHVTIMVLSDEVSGKDEGNEVDLFVTILNEEFKSQGSWQWRLERAPGILDREYGKFLSFNPVRAPGRNWIVATVRDSNGRERGEGKLDFRVVEDRFGAIDTTFSTGSGGRGVHGSHVTLGNTYYLSLRAAGALPDAGAMKVQAALRVLDEKGRVVVDGAFGSVRQSRMVDPKTGAVEFPVLAAQTGRFILEVELDDQKGLQHACVRLPIVVHDNSSVLKDFEEILKKIDSKPE